jgi:hypothetical protein
MAYPHLGGKLPSALRPGKGRHFSDLIFNVPTLIILAALVYAASILARRHDGLEAGQGGREPRGPTPPDRGLRMP